MTATEPNGTTDEKLTDNIFASMEQRGADDRASVDVRTFDNPDDDNTELVFNFAGVALTVGLSPEQTAGLRNELQEALDDNEVNL